MKTTNLDDIKRVRLNDFSQYDREKSNNGGSYGFWTDYNRVDGGWKVSYGTTADFEFCPCCGDFHRYDEEECGDFEIISTEELQVLINNFKEKETEDYYIEMK